MGNTFPAFGEGAEKEEKDEDKEENKDKKAEPAKANVQDEGEKLLQKLEEKIQEDKVKVVIPKGQFASLGKDYYLGKLRFMLEYDVKKEILRVTIKEGIHLRGVATTESELDVYATVCLIKKEMSLNIADIANDAEEVDAPPERKLLSKLFYKAEQYRKPKELAIKGEYKTMPMSTSVRCNTSHPRWDDTFVYKGIQNKELKKLRVQIVIMDKGRTSVLEKPKNESFILGEILYDCARVHKKLQIPKQPTAEMKDLSDTEGVDENDEQTNQTSTEKPSTKASKATKQKSNKTKNTAEEVQRTLVEDVDAYEDEIIEKENVGGGFYLPLEETERGEAFVEEWMIDSMAKGYWPKEGADFGGMPPAEEQRSYPADWTPDSDSDDSGIIDSVSVLGQRIHEEQMKKERQMAENLLQSDIFEEEKENGNILIKDVEPSESKTKTESNGTEMPRNQLPIIPRGLINRRAGIFKAASEETLNEMQRPQITRKVHGWKNIKLVEGYRSPKGQIEIGLIFDPKSSTIVVKLIRAKDVTTNADIPDSIHATLECKRQTLEAVKANAISKLINRKKGRKKDGDVVRATELLGKQHRTESRAKTRNPVWNEAVPFEIDPQQLPKLMFDIHVWQHKKCLGCLRIAGFSENRDIQNHLRKMIYTPRYPITQWYELSL